MTTNNLVEWVGDINQEIFEACPKLEVPVSFTLTTNGTVDQIQFEGLYIWDDQDCDHFETYEEFKKWCYAKLTAYRNVLTYIVE